MIEELEQLNSELEKTNEKLNQEIERLKELSKVDSQQAQEIIIELKQEIERLNNIINELEKYLIEEIEDYDKHINSRYITDIAREQYEGEKVCFEDTLGKLQELKGNNEPSFEEMIGFIENVYKDIKSQSTLHEELEEERKTIAKIVGDFKEVNK